jgi:aspartate dehydrogenase
MLNLAIIGCGAIGTLIARYVDEKKLDGWTLIAVYDKVYDKAVKLSSSLKDAKPRISRNVDELLGSKPDLVVEAASQEAVEEFGELVLNSGSDIVILSVGALMDEKLLERLKRAAAANGKRIYVPSGAIAGVDALHALSLVGFDEITLRSSKPPEALSGKVGTLFKGHAEEAVKLFPANINVAATLRLASGSDVAVEIVSDPSLKTNLHEIIAYSKASNIAIKVENKPDPENPKTSYLAGLSVIALLKKLSSPIWLGN